MSSAYMPTDEQPGSFSPSSSDAGICDLPNTVVWHILSSLPAQDVCSVGLTCKKAKVLAHDDVGVWQERCRAAGVTSLQGWRLNTYRELYLTLLQRYGNISGIWSGQVEQVGSLLVVEADPPCIHGWAVVPRLINGPNMKSSIFRLTVEGPGRLIIQCKRPGSVPTPTHLSLGSLRGCGPHAASIVTDGPDAFELDCSDACRQKVLEPRSRLLAAVAPLPMGTPEPEIRWPEITQELRELQLLQYVISHQALWSSSSAEPESPSSGVTRYHRLAVPEGRHPLEGLWKGSYGGHGLEMLSVSLSDDGKQLVGIKVTADPNVHHSQVTFQVQLTHPIDGKGRLLNHPQPEDELELPNGFTTDVDFSSAPRLRPVARYRAEGQVARKGFREPKMVPLQFIVFEGGAFGVSWLSLTTFSMFVRLQLPGRDAPFLEDLASPPSG